ncbi:MULTISPECIES: ATP-binding cassette domain-containing protein [unclassified Mycolicibacterium]|uniref:ATP-binding cassette domain-containing protein n=1 Tax=unclassified Mycolicibacterium TaxID=2636767 RepID=UPI0012DE7953|nr:MULTISPECIES: ATP-binding cassette domain-containing protein [unclassified Mycolicibacterium]MUL85657.1 sugar ABC transporter ATP-binding protein [Mycolicibacterium sp. CBMA 329]MUL91534.1 sugar ABC transporter ATP-binding protein [Mycolicibacterium sp. CBMA 331]MUM02226.1 sugar ABC transporter ATP-binding protein [Mycolicibacterium sp. CBMA 334]MUM27315.1 sugar ABC transporter ATP-binding protein [Mycolicibacterium sp. CBMA 295]MUM41176.1 sugar ABC transporter ATP-binding protein [Mycolici
MTTSPVIEVRNAVKKFNSITALDKLDFDLYPGEVVALIGDNGAGKSTLVKVISGVHRLDGGQLLLGGKPAEFSSPRDAKHQGIETVHQDLALAPHLNVVENMYLGREVLQRQPWGRLGFMQKNAMASHAETVLKELGVKIRAPKSPVGAMSGGQRQGVAIARAISWTDKVLILDEPTSALGVEQTGNVLNNIRRVRERGIAVIFISHTMPHVMEVSDRVQVLRRGRRVASLKTSETSMDELVAYMTGAVAA